jgi:hypothetical protein
MVILYSDIAVAWEASALFDIFISGLTLLRTLKVRKVHNTANSSLVELLNLILRDGKPGYIHQGRIIIQRPL